MDAFDSAPEIVDSNDTHESNRRQETKIDRSTDRESRQMPKSVDSPNASIGRSKPTLEEKRQRQRLSTRTNYARPPNHTFEKETKSIVRFKGESSADISST